MCRARRALSAALTAFHMVEPVGCGSDGCACLSRFLTEICKLTEERRGGSPNKMSTRPLLQNAPRDDAGRGCVPLTDAGSHGQSAAGSRAPDPGMVQSRLPLDDKA